jgi:hypothetical protein
MDNDYDDSTLTALQEAFRESWTALKAKRSELDWAGEIGLRSRLAEKLMSLADEGITHPAELSRRAVTFIRRSTQR